MIKVELKHKQIIDKKAVYRGQIYTADMSFTYKGDGSYGKSFEKVLIIQNNRGNYYSPTVIALTIKNDVADLYSLNTIDKKRLIALVGTLEEHKLNQVNDGLRSLLIGQSDESLIAL